MKTVTSAHDGTDRHMEDRAALQYAMTAIRTLSGVSNDATIRSMAAKFPGCDDLLDECIENLSDLQTILGMQSDGSSPASMDAYRTILKAGQPFHRAMRTMNAYAIAANLPGTLRDINLLIGGPVANLDGGCGPITFDLHCYLVNRGERTLN